MRISNFEYTRGCAQRSRGWGIFWGNSCGRWSLPMVKKSKFRRLSRWSGFPDNLNRLLCECVTMIIVAVVLPNKCVRFIDVIYYYVIWTDNGSKLLEADTRRQEGKYPMIKVSSYSVNTSVLSFTGQQYAICNTFIIRRLFLPTAMWASIYSVSTRWCPVISIGMWYITSMVRLYEENLKVNSRTFKELRIF